jgi:hypothetical protein
LHLLRWTFLSQASHQRTSLNTCPPARMSALSVPDLYSACRLANWIRRCRRRWRASPRSARSLFDLFSVPGWDLVAQPHPPSSPPGGPGCWRRPCLDASRPLRSLSADCSGHRSGRSGKDSEADRQVGRRHSHSSLSPSGRKTPERLTLGGGEDRLAGTFRQSFPQTRRPAASRKGPASTGNLGASATRAWTKPRANLTGR